MIRFKTINRTALAISLLTGGVVLVTVLLLDTLYAACIAATVSFLVVYLLCRIFIYKYVVQRIKPMYQMIFSEKLRTKFLEEKLKDRDIIDHINDDLQVWAETKTSEISRLRELEKYRKDFLGNVSHELKTPLFTLQGYLLTLLDGAINDERVSVRYLQQAEKNLDRLIAIVKDLEQISKLEAGELKLHMESFDITALAEEVTEILQPKAREMGITIKIENQLPVLVTADREQIERVLMNLTLNSINYGREEGTSTIRFIDMFDRVMVEVEDNGIGIPKECQPRIFERFYRVDKSRSRDQGGTGLGLAIVKHIVEAHDQNITLRSKPGEGTTFSFTLSKTQ